MYIVRVTKKTNKSTCSVYTCTCMGFTVRMDFTLYREQRVTLFVMSILVGLSVMLYSVTSFIPLPVLYGLLFYLGVASLYGIQFVHRFKLLFIPNKYKPDYAYLRQVPNVRIHIYTIIQIVLLVLLCALQAQASLRVIFPIIVIGLMIIRWLLGFCFTRKDLKVLDDPLPEKLYCKRCEVHVKKNSERNLEEGSSNSDEIDGVGNVVTEEPPAIDQNLTPDRNLQRKERRSASDFNITQEVDKCEIWRTMVKDLESPYSSPIRRAAEYNGTRPSITVTDPEILQQAVTYQNDYSPLGNNPLELLGDSPFEGLEQEVFTEVTMSTEQDQKTKSKACRKLFTSTAV